MPLPVITIAQMRQWEQATWAAGQTEAEIIRRVGERIGRLAASLTGPGDLILILAGKGHNGDDARCARETLKERRVEVLEVTHPAADLSKLEASLSLHPALIIDGLFGIGINRTLDAGWVRFIQRVNQAHARVLAVDVPSGLNADTGQPQGAAIEAAVTLTVGAPKAGLLEACAWQFVGRLEVADNIGLIPCPLSSDREWVVPQDFRDFPQTRPVATHKGSYGHLGILAGSLGYHGAAVLAARGAQRAQPGLITLFPQPAIYPMTAGQLQAVMVSPWHSTEQLPGPCNTLVIGPGLASADLPEALKGLVRELWRTSPLPLIVDASALSWLLPGPVQQGAVRVITPHPGEAARLLGRTAQEVQANRWQALRDLSGRFGNAWVVLKGHQTLIGQAAGPVYVNSSGNPHLAQGGSGDVLSGYLGGLLAQPTLRLDPVKTIAYAVWQHGATADYLQATRRSWVVEDLLESLGAGRAG